VPSGKTIITFTPAKAEVKPRMTEGEEIEWINKNIERLKN